MRCFPAMALALLLGAASARADVLHLKGGGTLEGDVVREGDGYRVRLPGGGEAVVPAADVERVETGDTRRDEYLRRLNALDRTDAEGHYRLGLFCQDAGLRREAEALFRHAVAVQPNHEGARAALGHVFFEGQWMPLEESMRRQGLVRHGAKWVTPEERTRLEAEDRARAQAERVRRIVLRVRSTDRETAEAAARELGAIGDEAARAAVVEATRHWHADVRLAAAPAVGRYAAREAEDARAALVRMCCREEDLRVQDAAIAAIAASRVAAAADGLLAEYVQAEDARVRNAAAHALGAARWKPAFPALVGTLTFTVLKNRLVPAQGVGQLVGPPPGGAVGPHGGRLVFQSYALQRYEVRVVADLAFNDAARGALKDLCGADYDFDRTGWLKWWDANAAGLDVWMRPKAPSAPAPERK